MGTDCPSYNGSDGDSNDDEWIGGGSNEDDKRISYSGHINLSSVGHHLLTLDQKGGRHYV